MSPTALPDLTCTDEDARRALLAAKDAVHGIDYIEVSASQLQLDVHFVKKDTATGTSNLKSMLDALAATPSNARVRGGERVRHIKVTKVKRFGERLLVTVAQPGDFSPYTFALTHPQLDPAHAAVQFSFKAGCPSRFDCRGGCFCDPPDLPSPAIDYMAKDFDSFRQALLDRLPTIAPDWLERNEADLGIALIELLAYAGDQLSYQQDAVSNEAYLDSARQRISVRRHARLLDYLIDEGASARAFVVAEVDADCTMANGSQLLTRRELPLEGQLPPLAAVLQPSTDELVEQARTDAAAVFETLADAHLHKELNPITIHAWDLGDCCLPTGTTTLDLEGDLWFDASKGAVTRQEPWRLRAGSFLLVEETVGVPTLLPGDADPTHRQVVRLTNANRVDDPLVPGSLTRVTWAGEDALTFPLCVSARDPEGVLQKVAVARGNVLVAHHGERREQWWPLKPTFGGPGPALGGLTRGPRPPSLLLREGPPSVWRMVRDKAGNEVLPDGPVARMNKVPARLKIDLTVVSPIGVGTTYERADDLIDAGMFTKQFVAEVTNDGRARLRFGDGTNGLQPADGSFVNAVYRVGRGRAGNVGAETLAHILLDPMAAKPPVKLLRNPLPASGGADPETISQVKVSAPVAFRSPQMRAVTEADYAEVATRFPGVAGAVARFRWTASWLTVYLMIDAHDRTALDRGLPDQVKAFVQGFTQTSYDLEIRPALYVPLDVELFVCVAPDRFRAGVEHELLAVLSSRRLPGRKLGFFHPDRFGFGKPLYLSALYAAAQAVPGVVSVTAKRFSRFYDDDPLPNRPITAANIDAGLISTGELEVLELDNDPSVPERGVLSISIGGGR